MTQKQPIVKTHLQCFRLHSFPFSELRIHITCCNSLTFISAVKNCSYFLLYNLFHLSHLHNHPSSCTASPFWCTSLHLCTGTGLHCNLDITSTLYCNYMYTWPVLTTVHILHKSPWLLISLGWYHSVQDSKLSQNM